MKKVFGEPVYVLRKITKKYGLELDKAVEFGINNLTKLFGFGTPEFNRHAAHLKLEHFVLTGNAIHYFIDTEELAEFIKSTSHHFDSKFFDLYDFTEAGGAIVIHTTGETPECVMATAVGLMDASRKVSKYACIANGQVEAFFKPSEADSIIEGESFLDIEVRKAVNLLYGLGLYLTCFPESAKDGLPDETASPAHFRKERCISIGAVPQVVDRSGKSPHFRKGHFRTLRAERFTNKRWQVVWVSESFVKGTAKTVEDVLQPAPEFKGMATKGGDL